MSVYKFKDEYRGNVPAQVAGETLAKIGQACGGHCKPSAVVDYARPQDSSIHSCFEWDDAVAAEHHRDQQARMLINCVYEVVVTSSGTLEPIASWANVVVPEVGRCYVTPATVMSDDDLKAQVESDAIAALRAWRKRYESIKRLTRIFAAIDAALAEK